jgi:putative nucleotidyltransferase with HDIG domain
LTTILLLTDAPARGRRLARGLDALGDALVVDVLDPDADSAALPGGDVAAVVGDVSLAQSRQVAELRRRLDRFGPRRPPFLCLLHEDTPRARAQADALGATRILRAGLAARMLAGTLRGMALGGGAAPTSLAGSVAGADAVLSRILELGRSGDAVTPDLIAAGADLVEQAVRRSDVRSWLDVVRRFDDATHQHCLIVAGLAAGFARHLRLGRADSQILTQAALLHDVGKSRIPLDILNKPARLDPREMAVMRGHPVLGHEMLTGQAYPEALLAVVRSHHEALDGTGYPDGLRGDRIPDLVRLVTVCDVFGALVERRPYKRSSSGEQAYAVLQDMGGKLDRDLVRAFQPLAEAAGP